MLLQIKCDKLHQKISRNAYLFKNQVFRNKTHIFRKNAEKPGFWKTNYKMLGFRFARYIYIICIIYIYNMYNIQYV